MSLDAIGTLGRWLVHERPRVDAFACLRALASRDLGARGPGLGARGWVHGAPSLLFISIVGAFFGASDAGIFSGRA